jgi:hypothetical protein
MQAKPADAKRSLIPNLPFQRAAKTTNKSNHHHKQFIHYNSSIHFAQPA